MNYIKRLQLELGEAMRRLEAIQNLCQADRVYLQTPKFTGVDVDGERKDWIATTDVDLMLQTIHSKALVG